MHFAAVKVMPFVPELRDRLNELKWGVDCAWLLSFKVNCNFNI